MRAAVLFRDQGDFSEAEVRFERALQAAARLGVTDPRHEEALGALTALYDSHGQVGKGAVLLERWMPALEESLTGNHPRLAAHLERWAWFCYQAGRLEDAESQLIRALAILDAGDSQDPRGLARVRHRLGLVYQARQQWRAAEEEQRRALGLLEAAVDEEDLDLARVRTELAGLYVTRGRWSEAEPLVERGLPALQNRLRGPLPILLHGLAYRAVVRLESGAGPGALRDVSHLLLLYDRASVGVKGAEQSRLILVAESCERAGRLDEAGEVYLRLTAFRSRFHGAESPEAAAPTHRLGRVLLAQGRFEEAEEILRRSMVAYENADPRHPHQLAEVLESYADLMEATGRPRRARTLRRRAATLR